MNDNKSQADYTNPKEYTQVPGKSPTKFKEPLIASNSINENTVLKRNKTNIQTNKKRFDGNDVEDLNNKKYTFSDRSPMVLGAPDSPTLTYEKRLFMKKSFEGRSNQDHLLNFNTNEIVIKTDSDTINNVNLVKKSVYSKKSTKSNKYWCFCFKY